MRGRRGWAGGGGGAQRMAKARPSDAAGPALGRYGFCSPYEHGTGQARPLRPCNGADP